jgi:hypothetical protein
MSSRTPSWRICSLITRILAIDPAWISKVNFHNRWHEGRRSGADFGVVVTRPSFLDVGWPGEVSIVRDQARALLAQAKLGKGQPQKDGILQWGQLTMPQEQLIPTHQGYYALLLYRLTAGNALAPFRWQLCEGCTVDEIKGWLRSGIFPNEISSGHIINALSAGSIGTDSGPVIDSFADPPASRNNAIEIRVFWPDGTGPHDRVSLQLDRRQETEHHIRLH